MHANELLKKIIGLLGHPSETERDKLLFGVDEAFPLPEPEPDEDDVKAEKKDAGTTPAPVSPTTKGA